MIAEAARHLCIYYRQAGGACASKLRPGCPWWRKGTCSVKGKIGRGALIRPTPCYEIPDVGRRR